MGTVSASLGIAALTAPRRLAGFITPTRLVMTAFKSWLKTAIPHSIRRSVLNPRQALWPRRPTKIATKYREHVPDRDLQVRWSRRVAGGPGVCCSL